MPGTRYAHRGAPLAHLAVHVPCGRARGLPVNPAADAAAQRRKGSHAALPARAGVLHSAGCAACAAPCDLCATLPVQAAGKSATRARPRVPFARARRCAAHAAYRAAELRARRRPPPAGGASCSPFSPLLCPERLYASFAFPTTQADGCLEVLRAEDTPRYRLRYRLCALHLRAEVAVVRGIPSRFCQARRRFLVSIFTAHSCAHAYAFAEMFAVPAVG